MQSRYGSTPRPSVSPCNSASNEGLAVPRSATTPRVPSCCFAALVDGENGLARPCDERLMCVIKKLEGDIT